MNYPFKEETNEDFLFGIFPRLIASRPAESSGCSRLDKDASHYRMDYNRRGLTAIFNQVGCDGKRGYVEKDVKSLFKTFTRLGFEIEIFDTLSYNDIECALENLGQRDHSDCDCFVLIYLSRGTDGKLSARDRIFDVNVLWRCFTAEQSPTLANKPKVFIVQGYKESTRSRRGRLFGSCEDCAFLEEDDPDNTSGSDRLRSYYIPERSDFLIVLSTVQGVILQSKSRQMGSLYIQILCQHLNYLGFSQDFMSILTEVTHHVRTVGCPSTSCDNGKRQIPTIISLLIRILQFTDKCSKRDECNTERFGEVEEDSDIELVPSKKMKISKPASHIKSRKKNESRPK